MESIFAVFMSFFIANIVLVIRALVEAIRVVPDDPMYQAGTKLIWMLVILFGGFVVRSSTSPWKDPSAQRAARGPVPRPLRIGRHHHRRARSASTHEPP